MQDYKLMCLLHDRRRKGEIMQNKRVAISGDGNELLSLSSLHFLVPNTFSIIDV